MANNTTLNPGTGGDVTRSIDRAGVKSTVVVLDVGGAPAESLLVLGRAAAAASIPVAMPAADLATLATEATLDSIAGSPIINSPIQTADYDTGVGTDLVVMRGIALPKSGGAVAGGTATDPVRTDPTGATTQPVSGTVQANAGTNLNTSALALDATVAKDGTLTGGTAKAIARGGTKGTTTPADITSTASGANHQPGDVILYDAAGNVINPTLIRALTAADIMSAAGTTAHDGAGAAVPPLAIGGYASAAAPADVSADTDVVRAWLLRNGAQVINLASGGTLITLGQKAMTGSLPVALASDQSALPITDNAGSLTVDAPVGTPMFVRLSDGTAAIVTLPVQGGKTNNAAAPGATNMGVMDALANEALASNTEGNLIFPSADLRGVWRVIDTAEACLGEYEWQGITGGYTGLAAGTPLFAMRWGDATRFCRLLRVEVLVFASTAATVAGITERQLKIARSFTVSDTGGTAATLTGNNQKSRTSDATSLMTDLRIGNPLTAGTRTLDAAPAHSAAGWSGLLSTGMVIGAFGSSPVGAARSTEGGGQFQILYNGEVQGARKIVFAQNEGAVVVIGAAMPTTVVEQTMVKVKWREMNKAN